MGVSSVTDTYTDVLTTITGNAVYMAVCILMLVLLIIGWWKIFEKAGYEGWKSIIPFYNSYIIYELSFGKGKGWMFLLTLVPCVGVIVEIVRAFKMATAFGKGVGFGFGLLIFYPIFALILGFGSAEYKGV